MKRQHQILTRSGPTQKGRAVAAARRGGNVLVVGIILGTTAAFGLAGPASAGTTKAPFAVLRAAHFSPTTPGVDIYLGSFSGSTATAWISGVHYGAVSPYEEIKPGLYTVAVRPHGATAGSRPMLSWTLNARAGRAYTVAGVGSGSHVRGVVLADDLSTPPAGQGRVRVIQAASRAPKLTVRASGGPTIVKGERFGTASDYRAVPAGHWKLAAVSDADAAVRATADVQVRAGQTESVLVLDAANGAITIRSLLDSAAPGAMPKGSVNAGGGGTATSFTAAGHGARTAYWAISLVATSALLVGTAGRWARRRRPGTRSTA